MPNLTFDPIWGSLAACAFFIAYTYVVSLITGNHSQVDRLWSIIPGVYVVGFTASAGFRDLRLDVMAVLVVAWGARLTFNFARKGGYRRGGEDYRWPELRKRLGPVKFQLLNATFIAPYQNILLLLISLPAYVAWQHRGTPFGALDAAATLLFVSALIGETIADQQQWRFHEMKRERQSRGEPVEPPFLTRGLFAYARHPNFFFEQAQWFCLYALGVAASGTLWNWGLPGPVLLLLLFQGSAAFTERLSVEKYPSYRDYQRTTPRQLPLPFLRRR